MAGLCALGSDWSSVGAGLRSGRSGVAALPELAEIAGLRTQLGAPVAFERPAEWPRKALRSMGRVSQLAVRASEAALAQAGLAGSPLLRDGSTGIAYGSTSGSPPDMVSYARAFGVDAERQGRDAHRVSAPDEPHLRRQPRFLLWRARPHPADPERLYLGQPGDRLRLRGDPLRARRRACCAAAPRSCTRSRSRSSTCCSPPRRGTTRPRRRRARSTPIATASWWARAPRPSSSRSSSAARARGAAVLAEVVGYATNCDGGHLTAPDVDGMEAVMRLGLADAGLAPEGVGYVSAHATATEQGDRRRERGHPPRLRRPRAGELAEGPPRPHPRRLRSARGLAHDRDAARGLGRADAPPRAPRPGAAPGSTT